MKHPALTRIFAIVLAILCLAMLLAGAGIVRSALRERDKGRADLTRLRDRMDEYAQILRQLEGTTRFEEIDRELSERQGAHDEQAVRHRTDLAIYTATRSGLLTGAASLREAADALAQGRAQYEAGLAMFQEQEAAFYEGYAQFQEGKRQLAEARATLDMTAQALAATRAQLAQLRSLSAVLESDDPDARLELSVETYDLLLGSMDQAMGMYGQLKDQGGISAEQMQMLATMLAQQYGVDADEFLENVEWQGIDAATMEEWETRIVEATGMTPEELRAQIQEQRDSIGGEDGQQPLSEEQFAALQAAYALNKAQIDAMASVLEEQIAVYEAQLADAQAQMDEAQAQIDAMDAYMEQGKTAIEQGRAALDAAGGQLWSGQKAIDDGFAQIREKEAELDEQEEELRKE
ncbi:MAG: hypothetical protein IK095_01815, partial [Oscillospiraceae bacterium]|nr:hypothetical protein [Oscillospiraceae bacterium]